MAFRKNISTWPSRKRRLLKPQPFDKEVALISHNLLTRKWHSATITFWQGNGIFGRGDSLLSREGEALLTRTSGGLNHFFGLFVKDQISSLTGLFGKDLWRGGRQVFLTKTCLRRPGGIRDQLRRLALQPSKTCAPIWHWCHMHQSHIVWPPLWSTSCHQTGVGPPPLLLISATFPWGPVFSLTIVTWSTSPSWASQSHFLKTRAAWTLPAKLITQTFTLASLNSSKASMSQTPSLTSMVWNQSMATHSGRAFWQGGSGTFGQGVNSTFWQGGSAAVSGALEGSGLLSPQSGALLLLLLGGFFLF